MFFSLLVLYSFVCWNECWYTATWSTHPWERWLDSHLKCICIKYRGRLITLAFFLDFLKRCSWQPVFSWFWILTIQWTQIRNNKSFFKFLFLNILELLMNCVINYNSDQHACPLQCCIKWLNNWNLNTEEHKTKTHTQVPPVTKICRKIKIFWKQYSNSIKSY